MGCGLAEGWSEHFQRQGRRLVNNRAKLRSMNYVEDSEYLGSCESLGLLMLMVRQRVLICTTTSLCSWVNWYHLVSHWKRQFRPLKINICPQTSQPPIGRNHLALPHNPVISAAFSWL